MYTNSYGVHKREMRNSERNCSYHYAEDVTDGSETIQELLSQMDSPSTDGMTTPRLWQTQDNDATGRVAEMLSKYNDPDHWTNKIKRGEDD